MSPTLPFFAFPDNDVDRQRLGIKTTTAAQRPQLNLLSQHATYVKKIPKKCTLYPVCIQTHT